MKKLIFLAIVWFFSVNSYSQLDFQGDLSFLNYSTNNTIIVKIESESIVFEGNHWIVPPINNRNHIFQNGNTYRRYNESNHNVYDEWQVTKHEFSVQFAPFPNVPTQINTNYCSGNVNTSQKAYGCGKYLITITTPNKVYKFYFNNLDSEYGNMVNGISYSNDFFVEFNGENQPIYFHGNFGDRYISEYNPQNPIPELKVWELIYNASEPLATRFYVSSTPFGYSLKPGQEYLDSYKPNMYIGPHVILDKVNPSDPYDQSVYPYSETTERGYNTFGWDYGEYGQTLSYDYYNSPPIPANQNDPGKTYVTPAIYVPNGSVMAGTNFIAESGNIFELGANNKFWISSYDINQYEGVTGDALTFKKNSHLILGANAKIQTCRMGKFIDEGSIKEFSSGNVLRAWGSTDNGWSFLSEIKFIGNNETHTINNGARVEIDANASLTVGNNTTVIFDGQNTCLQLKQGSQINLGTNAKLIFQNGAHLDATNIAFSIQNSSYTWSGIDFINAGSSTITGCTFSDCQRPISIYNDLPHASNNQTITNNTFNLTGNTSDRGIYAENLYSLNAQNNTFNLGSGSIGIYIKDYDLSSMENNESLYFSLILKNNIFNSGSISLVLASYMLQTPSYYIEGNTFNNNSYINILGRDMQGTIKNNSSYGSSARALHFTQSDPEVYNNTFYSTKNILAGSQSVVHIEPIITETGIVWYGGRNYMQASGQDNVEYNYGYVTMDNGENRFIRSGSNYHLYGIIEPEGNYYTRNNCFDNSNTPISLIWDINNNPVNPIIYGSTFNCNNSTNDGIDWVIREIGSGLYDSVKVTALPSGTQLTQEEILYAQAVNNYNNSNYFNAVTDFKSLINQYPGFTSIISCLYKIYTCYENLDTVPNQENRDILYGNLVTYLSEKINSGLYSEEFNEIAYNLILGCYTNMTEYNEALDGYEFISLFHPNPELRLLASWDYAEVEALIGTGGAISSREEKMTSEEFKDYRVQRMNKLIKGDPIKEKMKKTFSNSSKKRDENTKKQLAKLTKDDAEIKMQNIKNEESKLINKAINNLRTAKTLTKSDKEKKQLEDLLLSAGITDLNRKSINTESKLPFKYELSQNYPNPFNPVTNIKYQLPKDGLVTLKVYDITGREIAKLVNEVKQAGYYTVSFNGSNFASGVYFYRIQAGDFIQVKKMVLIK